MTVREPPAADLTTLVELGQAERPPEPQERGAGRGRGRPAVQQSVHETMLLDALQQAGVVVTGRETTAVAALAGLDTASVGTVVQWIRHVPTPAVAPAEPPPSTPGKGAAPGQQQR